MWPTICNRARVEESLQREKRERVQSSNKVTNFSNQDLAMMDTWPDARRIAADIGIALTDKAALDSEGIQKL